MTVAVRPGRALLVAVLLCCLAEDAAAAVDLPFRPMEITTQSIGNFQIGSEETRFGALEYLGGLQVMSEDKHFGSLSGLDFSADGKSIFAVSDSGTWFTADLDEDDGHPVGLSHARFAPLLDATGEPMIGKKKSDAEGLRIVRKDGKETAYVSFEQETKVRKYVAAPEFAGPKSTIVKLPEWVSGLRRNSGLEAIAIAPEDSPLAGSIVLVAESSLNKAGDHRAWVLSGPRAGEFYVHRSASYDVTDAAFLPDGDLLILERRFGFAEGLGMRIRRIIGASIKPGATLDGEVLIDADMRYQIDNMEGLAVRTEPDGRTIIAVVSDDNQGLLQRTLLLFFALPAKASSEGPPPPAQPVAPAG